MEPVEELLQTHNYVEEPASNIGVSSRCTCWINHPKRRDAERPHPTLLGYLRPLDPLRMYLPATRVVLSVGQGRLRWPLNAITPMPSTPIPPHHTPQSLPESARSRPGTPHHLCRRLPSSASSRFLRLPAFLPVRLVGPAPAVAAADFLTRIQRRSMSVAHRTTEDLPADDAPIFTLLPVGSTSRRFRARFRALAISAVSSPCRLLAASFRQASALPSPSSRFAVTRDTPAVPLPLSFAGA